MSTKFNKIKTIFLLISGSIAIGSNSYQQALNYSTALNKSSKDITTTIASSSNSGLYWALHQLTAIKISPFIVSIVLNFLLLYFFQSSFNSILNQLGFKRKISFLITLFSVFTYSFLSPFAYEIQIFGPITQARLTPVIVLTLFSLLLCPMSTHKHLKIFFLLVLALWAHLVIGVFLLNFVLLIEILARNKSFYVLILTGLNLFSVYSGLRVRSNEHKIEVNKFLTIYQNQIYDSNFCQHYTNFESILSKQQFLPILLKLLIYFIVFIIILFQYQQRNSQKFAFRVIGIFYFYSFLVTVFLNVIIFLNTTLSITALAIMPMRFLDIANIFAFPILIYHLKSKENGLSVISILSILVLGRVINGRLLEFMFKENELHFFILGVLIFISYALKKVQRKKNLNSKVSLMKNIPSTVMALFLGLFLVVQISHQISSPSTDWNSFRDLNRLPEFRGSKILTSEEVDFPMALYENIQVLDHGELQSLLYVPEQFSYVESILVKYYGTNLTKFFGGESCSLQSNPNTREFWESLDRSEWHKLSIEDGFKFVIVPAEWKLRIKSSNLPQISLGTRFKQKVTIYLVP